MIIGIDAGGTHTKATLFTEAGEVKDTLEIGSVHPLQKGYVYCAIQLANLCEQLCAKNQVGLHDVSVGIGLAGYGQDYAIRKCIEEAFVSHMPCAYTLVNDVEIALQGALYGEDGIVIIAGTGSIAYAKKANAYYRSGGFGFRIGDEGSAYWIGRKLLEIFSKQCDGRLQKSKLYTIICTELQLQNDFEIIAYAEQHHERSAIAKLATYVHKAALVNDQYAIAIYDEAAKELAVMANVLQQHFTGIVNVSYYGGVFHSGGFILEPLRKYLKDHLQLKEPIVDPAKGAFLIRKNAMQL